VYGVVNFYKSLNYKATTFAYYYIVNLVYGRIKRTPSPLQSQFSNINDLMISQLNKDGELDILTVGNLFASEIETPRNDAGTGLWMLGDGAGNFSVLTNKERGFFANRNAKKIVMISNKKQKKI